MGVIKTAIAIGGFGHHKKKFAARALKYQFIIRQFCYPTLCPRLKLCIALLTYIAIEEIVRT